jgi:Kelch motif
MNKQTTTTIMTHLRWGVFFLVLLFLVIHVIPRALGQRDGSAPSLNENPTVLCTPGWSAGPDLPSTGVRMVGVSDPVGAKFGFFYAMGGRSMDGVGNDFIHPFRYEPESNNWATVSATYPDNQVSNMACGDLLVGTSRFIYCVGGSAGWQTTATARVFRYDWNSNTITTLTAADNWPGDAAGTILPGGFAVVNNKLYILGGFNINVASTNEIWEFDPTACRRLQMDAEGEHARRRHVRTYMLHRWHHLPGRGIGFPGWHSGRYHQLVQLRPRRQHHQHDSTIPRATGETRALNFNGQMWVMGGGRDAPNPSNEVNVYDPGTNTWSLGPAFVTGRRNFPTDTFPDTGFGNTHIYLAGGYDITGIPVASMEKFCQAGDRL